MARGVIALGPLAAVAMPAVAGVVAAADGPGFDPIALIGSVITPTIVIVLLLMGKLHTHGEVQRLESEKQEKAAENAALQASLGALQTSLTERVIPALTRATIVLEAISPFLHTDIQLRPPGGD